MLFVGFSLRRATRAVHVAEQLAHVVDQQFWLFEHGEVSASRHLCPANQVHVRFLPCPPGIESGKVPTPGRTRCQLCSWMWSVVLMDGAGVFEDTRRRHFEG